MVSWSWAAVEKSLFKLWKKKWKVAETKQETEEQNLANIKLYFIVKPKRSNFQVFMTQLCLLGRTYGPLQIQDTPGTSLYEIKNDKCLTEISPKNLATWKRLAALLLCNVWLCPRALTLGLQSTVRNIHVSFFFYWLGSKVHRIAEEWWGAEAGTAE